MRIIYIVLTFLMCVFHALYKGDLSFILLVFLLVLPLALFVMLTVQSFFLKISAADISGAAGRGKRELLRITVENRSFLPVASVKLKFRYISCFPPDKPKAEKYIVSAPVSPRSKETLTVGFTPVHCGYVDISVKYAVIGDLLGLTAIPRKFRLSDRITVMPSTYEFYPNSEKNSSVYSESDKFSAVSPGDDPSEIFELREYRSGDSMNRIHWKLSSRGEEFIVKELSLPAADRVLILCDTGSCGNCDDFDAMLDIAATLSAFLVKLHSAHIIAAPAEDGTLFTAHITESEDFAAAFTEMCGGTVSFGKRVTDESCIRGLSDILRKGCSRVLAVSKDDGKAFTEELLRICGETALTVFCTAAPSEQSKDTGFSSAEIIYSLAENLNENIYKQT